MVSTPCPRCGKKIDSDRETLKTDSRRSARLCNECFIENTDILKTPKEIEIEVCSLCSSYKDRGEWKSGKPEEKVALGNVEDILEIYSEAEDVEVGLFLKSHGEDYKITCNLSAKVRDIPVTEEKTVKVNVKRVSCPSCSKAAGEYYESLVQVRAKEREIREKEKDRALKIASEIVEKDTEAFISKIEETDGGIDIYMGKNKAGEEIARKLGEYGSMSSSASLIGEKEGERLYRVTYSVRLPKLTRGDIVVSNGTPFLVEEVSNNTTLRNLKTGNKNYMENKKAEKAEKIGKINDAETTSIVSESKKEFQILDPETYETITLEKPDFIEGQEIKVIKTHKGVFPVPS